MEILQNMNHANNNKFHDEIDPGPIEIQKLSCHLLVDKRKQNDHFMVVE